MTDITITPIDDVYMKVDCIEEFIKYELNDFFSFEIQNAKFNPKVKAKIWDGIVRLYTISNGKLYKGLIHYVEWYASQNGYSVTVDPSLKNVGSVSLEKTDKYLDTLNLHAGNNPIKPRDFQAKAFNHVVNNDRALIVSPTASGKSLIIYTLIRFFLSKLPDNKKILIIVPTTSLVGQMLGDFKDYSSHDKFDAYENSHCIYKGANKNTDKRVVISTWQSIYKMPKQYFKQFGAVFGDEAHQFKSDKIGGIMKKLTECKYRVGLTGTIGDKNAPVNKLTLEGLFGKSYTTITTRELIDRGDAAKLDINLIKINYSDLNCKEVSGKTYQEEVDYIINHNSRNKFLIRLAGKLKGNTLLMFLNRSHGELLYKALCKIYPNRKIFIWHGNIDADQRNAERAIVENENDAIVVASYGTTSTGVSVKQIDNVIFGTPSKSEIRVLQTIGRGLRISKTKKSVKLYDVVDNLKWKSKRNYTLKHFIERVEIYNKQQFDYKTYEVKL